MIIFLADGQLGNQLFQYAFLRTIQNNGEKIVVVGFKKLLEVFEINDVLNFNIKNKYIRYLLYKISNFLFNFLSDNSIISSITVKYEYINVDGKEYRRETNNYIKKIGILKRIIFVRLGFFQSEKFFNKNILDRINIKQEYIERANNFLSNIHEGMYKVFVHIRRGDYEKYKVYDKSSLLPINYYKEQIKWFLKNKKNVYFIFLSDDLDFVKDKFNYLDNKIISTNDYKVDFAIMTLCNGAILSPSSFGWWGSYLMKDKGIIFAPKYWLGFKSRIEYQKGTLANFMVRAKV